MFPPAPKRVSSSHIAATNTGGPRREGKRTKYLCPQNHSNQAVLAEGQALKWDIRRNFPNSWISHSGSTSGSRVPKSPGSHKKIFMFTCCWEKSGIFEKVTPTIFRRYDAKTEWIFHTCIAVENQSEFWRDFQSRKPRCISFLCCPQVLRDILFRGIKPIWYPENRSTHLSHESCSVPSTSVCQVLRDTVKLPSVTLSTDGVRRTYGPASAWWDAWIPKRPQGFSSQWTWPAPVRPWQPRRGLLQLPLIRVLSSLPPPQRRFGLCMWVREWESGCPLSLVRRRETRCQVRGRCPPPREKMEWAIKKRQKRMRSSTLIAKEELEAAYRISHTEIMSTPSPMTGPWTATITGKGARSGAPIARWNRIISFLVANEALALSRDVSTPFPPRALASYTGGRRHWNSERGQWSNAYDPTPLWKSSERRKRRPAPCNRRHLLQESRRAFHRPSRTFKSKVKL